MIEEIIFVTQCKDVLNYTVLTSTSWDENKLNLCLDAEESRAENKWFQKIKCTSNKRMKQLQSGKWFITT